MRKHTTMIETDSGESARRGLGQRLFAWMHSQEGGGNYDETVAPYKRKLFGDLSGTVLEIGAGTGENFPFYPPGIRWIGIEPNAYMHAGLLKAAGRYGISGELRSVTAERLPVEDGSVDAVVSTLVLCSVSDQAGVLAEIVRVLRPGGRFVFVEHVAAPDHSRLWWMQKISKPFWRAAADGCNPDRETGAAIERAGFTSVKIERFNAPLTLASPHIAGKAVK